MLKPIFKSVLKISGITLLVIIVLYGFARLLDKSIGGIYDAARAPSLVKMLPMMSTAFV